ncbi:reticulon-like protein B21 isoform X1 [Raphanus sativus]|uniref:Reticulon-like protein B21 isoform X1 n=1 Tax=Raphanus sativus TaxID=3726 RepID=A0A6J0MTL8_RAPSA|nr:reticulon-like protein B21 isoform X1 [Raphanus sativus]
MILLPIWFISVVAYMGLIYLGLMFVFKAVIRRGVVEEEEMHKGAGVREEDVKRMFRVIMPYLNESLLQLRALFSGDPSTTLKVIQTKQAPTSMGPPRK